MKRWVCTGILFLAVLFSVSGLSEGLTEDNYPSVNSESNSCNGGQAFCMDHRFYVAAGSYSYLYEVDEDFCFLQPVMDMLPTDARYVPWNDWVYCVGRKKPGIFRFKLEDGYVNSAPERIVNAKILNYTVNDYGVFYSIRDTYGVFRVDHDGSNRVKLANHKIRSKNNVMRMMTFGDNLYYVESKTNHLFEVPCDGSSEARQIGHASIHYFTMALWKGKPIVIYVQFAPSNDEINRSYLGVMGLDGQRIPELSYLEDICSRYVNYMGGYLYFADSNQGKCLKRIPLSETQHEEELLVDENIGYIQAFDNWITAKNLNGNIQYFVNLETLDAYECGL